MQNKLYVFGYGASGRQIAKKMNYSNDIAIIENDEKKIKKAKEDGFNETHLIDITSDSDIYKLSIDAKNSFLICAMDDEAQNIFLVISLRSFYEDAKIVAISDSLETNQKLSIAGATKVIDIYKPSANRIYNTLDKPYVLKAFDILFDPQSKISFKEYKIPKNNSFIGKCISDLDLEHYRLILIGVMDLELGEHFTFTTHGHKHKIDEGDILVCMGKDRDLENFNKIINGEVND